MFGSLLEFSLQTEPWQFIGYGYYNCTRDYKEIKSIWAYRGKKQLPALPFVREFGLPGQVHKMWIWAFW